MRYKELMVANVTNWNINEGETNKSNARMAFWLQLKWQLNKNKI